MIPLSALLLISLPSTAWNMERKTVQKKQYAIIIEQQLLNSRKATGIKKLCQDDLCLLQWEEDQSDPALPNIDDRLDREKRTRAELVVLLSKLENATATQADIRMALLMIIRFLLINEDAAEPI